MWCDLWWPQCFQLLDFLSPCLQHRPLKARAAILCSAACIHTQGHQDKKKKDGEGTREREKVQCDRAVLRFHLLCIHKTLQGPPLHLSLPLLPVSQFISLLDFLSSCSKFFQHGAAASGNHNKTAALLLFKRLLYRTKDRKWNSRALTRRQIFAGRHDGEHTKDRLMSWQALLSWHDEGRWYQVARITI